MGRRQIVWHRSSALAVHLPCKCQVKPSGSCAAWLGSKLHQMLLSRGTSARSLEADMFEVSLCSRRLQWYSSRFQKCSKAA